MAKGKSAGRKLVISLGGLFLIPVRVEAVAREEKSNLHEYHKDDLGAGGRKKYCKKCNKELGSDDILKGIEVGNGIVTFSKEELDSLPLSTTKNIEIDSFVEVREVNQLAFEKTYYLTPDELGVEALNLFTTGMKKAGKVAVAKVALAQRENLCVIRPVNSGLILSTMFWQSELKDAPQTPKSEITDTQLDLIAQVIGNYSKAFDFGSYSDKYIVALNKMASDKLAGKQIEAVITPTIASPNIEDALNALVKGKDETKTN